MAQNISCPECHEGFGKDVENPYHMCCDNCGTEFYNQRGYEENEESDEEQAAHLAFARKNLN
jgi:hypothetical protein|tara:strand:+ start:342 stop:527 length:186 start_codon:yes stop_codon:yes gene_type:complete